LATPYNLKNQKELFSEPIFKNLAILDIYQVCKELET
jgi:hypothetical protein